VNDWRRYTEIPRIAYFSMEIGLMTEIPTYSGGLGILAGDTIRSAADLKLPLVAVTLISRKGYFRQTFNAEGWQQESAVDWKPEDLLELLPGKALITIENRDVKVQAWMYQVKSPTGGELPVLFLDTDIPGNLPEDRKITDHLYGGGEDYRLKQEIVLGIGGARLLQILGFQLRKYHLNEGHASLLTLELLNHHHRPVVDTWDERASWDISRVRSMCVFTTHTPVEAGHDRFPYDLVERIMGNVIPLTLLKELGGNDELNMTKLALNLSHFVNGVAKKHGEVSQALFPGFEVHAITNGIHPFTWASPYLITLYDKYLPGWANEPELLVRIDNIPDQELYDAHAGAKAYLFQYIEEKTGTRLDPEVLTIGFARRAATYKRANMIFTDPQRLLKIGAGKLQLVFSGKAHPRDDQGKEMILQILRQADSFGDRLKIVYLPNYDMELASRLIPGVDVWLNNPLRPLEASGTSGMKAALNGVPNFSVLDGWWIEGHIEGVTGWSIGPPPTETTTAINNSDEDVKDLYKKLEETIMPLYYNDRTGWIKITKNAIGKNAYYFNTHVMMRRYVTEAYLQ
jgi:starch phosphorylase